ncbi:hypothetical protein AWC38_SpisGene22675 [Stylophora pistillata]|uniref:Uncharacterized protein n=1 Tax=Stylophora pistillata TaxID=50429 RepID=A0A2B4R9T4_STYPI|nr:hypothetical protein AWC38_SpisGene22675 [Stylophora pistillata]
MCAEVAGRSEVFELGGESGNAFSFELNAVVKSISLCDKKFLRSKVVLENGCEITPEFREDNIAESMVEMLEHVQQLDNEEMPNARDVEDWLNLENELPNSPEMSDEEILATVVGDSTESESVRSDEEDEGEDEKLVSTKEAVQCLKKYSSWMESQNDIDPVQLKQLRRTMDFAV